MPPPAYRDAMLWNVASFSMARCSRREDRAPGAAWTRPEFIAFRFATPICFTAFALRTYSRFDSRAGTLSSVGPPGPRT